MTGAGFGLVLGLCYLSSYLFCLVPGAILIHSSFHVYNTRLHETVNCRKREKSWDTKCQGNMYAFKGMDKGGISKRNEWLEKPEVQEKLNINTLSKKGTTFPSPLKVMTRGKREIYISTKVYVIKRLQGVRVILFVCCKKT